LNKKTLYVIGILYQQFLTWSCQTLKVRSPPES